MFQQISGFLGFLPFIFLLVVFGAFVWFVFYAKIKRKKELREFCLNSGFEFDEIASSLSTLPYSSVSQTPAPRPSSAAFPGLENRQSPFSGGSEFGDREASGASGVGAYGDDRSRPSGASGVGAYGDDRSRPSGASGVGAYGDDPIYRKNSGLFGGLLDGLASYNSSPLDFTGLDIFKRGHSRRASNLVVIPFKNNKLFFFDYVYVTGGGKNSQTHFYTVALIKVSQLLPDFYLRSENFLDKITGLVGFNDIDIPGYEEFSKKYYLKGADVNSVLGFFNNERLTYLQRNLGWNIYARGNYIAVFRKKGYVKVSEYLAYAEEIKNLISSIGLE